MNRVYRILLIFVASASVLFIGCSRDVESPKAKYVFYFIGDGMGIQQVNLAQELLYNSLNEETQQISFINFPTVGLATTESYTRYITGSAAAGTALATGHKTSINTLGLNHDHTDTLWSVAHFAHHQGFNVGIATSVSIDHATPAAFYAHVTSRSLYHEIAHDLIKSGFKFFGSGGFRDPNGEKSQNPLGNVYEIGAEQGVLFTNSLNIESYAGEQFNTLVFEAQNPASGSSLKYRIDNQDLSSVSLSDITQMGIEVLGTEKGFFFMLEGGKIDWACHDNDAAAVAFDVLDLSDAVDVALSFYEKYPEQTLIVVTADHETGGMSIGNREMKYESDISILWKQNASIERLGGMVEEFFQQSPQATYHQFKDYIFSDNVFGVTPDAFSEAQHKKLQKVFQETVKLKTEKSFAKLAQTAIVLFNHNAGIGWTTGAHTASPVPVYAIGVGQELFSGNIDNTDIPRRIAQAMGVQME